MSEEKVITGRLKRPPATDGTPKPPKLFIATPAYGGLVTCEYVQGLLNLTRSLDASGLAFELDLLAKESLITRARNKQVYDFLQTDCTHILFIDADIGFKARDVKYLIESGLDVVCGAYPLKTIGVTNLIAEVKAGTPADKLMIASARYAMNATPQATNGAPIKGLAKAGTHFLEVMDAATGFLLISREAMQRYIAHYREELEYVADYEPHCGQTHWMVFQADRDPVALSRGEKARYLSEDFWFSRKWQLMGGIVWLCLGCKLTHTGPWRFEGDVSTLFEQKDAADLPLEAATGS